MMNSRRSMNAAFAAFAATLLSGCYTQVPIDTFPPPPATHLVAQLTDSGVVAMANAIGPGAQEVEGVVADVRNDSINLQMLRVDHRGGSSVAWTKEVVRFPRFALTRPTQRSFDRKRSWLAAGGVVVGAFVASQLFRAIGADSPPDDGGTPQNTLLLPFRLGR